MQDNEIPNPFSFSALLLVVLINSCVGEQRVWKHEQQPHVAFLNKLDAGRFQWFYKTAGQSQRDAIPVPILAPLARGVLDADR